VQPTLVVGVESVCCPSDITVGPDQQCARLDVSRGIDDIDAIGPPDGSLTRFTPEVQQYWPAML
jgi:hypothetical protein